MFQSSVMKVSTNTLRAISVDNVVSTDTNQRRRRCHGDFIEDAEWFITVLRPLHTGFVALAQVYKLITPHFLYTLRMNANARSTLINQDPLTGILEVIACFGCCRCDGQRSHEDVQSM